MDVTAHFLERSDITTSTKKDRSIGVETPSKRISPYPPFESVIWRKPSSSFKKEEIKAARLWVA